MLTRILTRHFATIMSYATALPKYAAGTQPFTVLIEGNIGSGKTTFLDHFNQFQDKICVIDEPVEKWRNLNGSNLLDLMYKNPERWAMPFQSYVTLTMLESHTLQTNKPIKLMERSLYSAKNCFVENMFKTGIIDEAMYHILQEWTTPEVVYERIRKRARSEEACVPLEYLQGLHELHENWLIKNRGNNTKVLEIEADLELEEIGREYKRSESVINASLHQRPKAIAVSPSKRLAR